MVPTALEIATEEDVEFRQGLPLDYLSYMGVQNSDKVCLFTRRQHFARAFIPNRPCLRSCRMIHGGPRSSPKSTTSWTSWGILLRLTPLWILKPESSFMTACRRSSQQVSPFSAMRFSIILELLQFLSMWLIPALFELAPPVEEAAGSVHGAPARWEEGRVRNAGAYITSQTRVGLLRAGCAR